MNNPKIHVAIPTYNREEMLHRLLRQIMQEGKGWRIIVGIYDDCSLIPIRIPAAFTIPHKLYRFMNNHGKEYYWELANRIFKDFQKTDADFLIYLADDLILKPGFFDSLIKAWKIIQEPAEATLSFFYDASRRGKSCWGKFEPVRLGDFWLTQWMDMAFLAPRNTLEALNFEVFPVDPARWNKNQFLSSGVGQQLSQRLRKLGLKMYHLDQNLADHGTHASFMNPHARRMTPLV